MTETRPKILIIDDTPINLMTLGSILADEFELQIALSGAMGLTLAAQAPPDLILLDILMPHMDGFQTCRLLKANPNLRHIPVIFVTALTESDDENEGLALGAADYLTKPLNIRIARQRIRNLLERERLRKEVEAYRDHLEQLVQARTEALSMVKEQEAHLESIAYYDPLTGVPNRRLLMDRLSQALAYVQRSGRNLAICYFDLDGFKPVNDQLGHDAGDQLLIEVTGRLKAVLRECDSLARLGGDEFVLLLGDIVGKAECCNILERVLAAIKMPTILKNHTVAVSASLGVTLHPQDDASADELIRHADQAMYLAKQAGKNCFVFYTATATSPDSQGA